MRIESVRIEASGIATVVAAGGFSFSAPLSRLEAAGIPAGSLEAWAELDDEAAGKLRSVSERWSARKSALSLVARAEQSQAGLGAKLAARGYSGPAVKAVLAELAAEGLVDDARYASAWAAGRAARRATGPARLAAELRSRGLGEDAVRAAILSLPMQEVLARAARLELQRIRKAMAAPSRRGGRSALRGGTRAGSARAEDAGQAPEDRHEAGPPAVRKSDLVRTLRTSLKSLGYRGMDIDDALETLDLDSP